MHNLGGEKNSHQNEAVTSGNATTTIQYTILASLTIALTLELKDDVPTMLTLRCTYADLRFMITIKHTYILHKFNFLPLPKDIFQ